jgi:hypothetical protein
MFFSGSKDNMVQFCGRRFQRKAEGIELIAESDDPRFCLAHSYCRQLL